VKVADVDDGSKFPVDNGHEAGFHFLGSFARERDGENVSARDALLEKERNAVHQSLRFA
jgi:hypothetical protein